MVQSPQHEIQQWPNSTIFEGIHLRIHVATKLLTHRRFLRVPLSLNGGEGGVLRVRTSKTPTCRSESIRIPRPQVLRLGLQGSHLRHDALRDGDHAPALACAVTPASQSLVLPKKPQETPRNPTGSPILVDHSPPLPLPKPPPPPRPPSPPEPPAAAVLAGRSGNATSAAASSSSSRGLGSVL